MHQWRAGNEESGWGIQLNFRMAWKKSSFSHQLVTSIGAQSPEAFFFRTPELTAKFVKIQNALYKQETSADEETISGSIDVGLVCAANFQGRWYRAEVISFKEHPDVVVSLVDKGLLSINVHASQIHHLPCSSWPKLRPFYFRLIKWFFGRFAV